MVDFSSDFSSDFEGIAFRARIRPVGSDDETTRECHKYEWDGKTSYSMPLNVPVEDVTITELDSTEANALLDRLHASAESVHHTTFEKVII